MGLDFLARKAGSFQKELARHVRAASVPQIFTPEIRPTTTLEFQAEAASFEKGEMLVLVIHEGRPRLLRGLDVLDADAVPGDFNLISLIQSLGGQVAVRVVDRFRRRGSIEVDICNPTDDE